MTAVPGSQAGRIRASARTQRSKSSGSAGTKPASPAVCESTCATVTDEAENSGQYSTSGASKDTRPALAPARAPRPRRRPWCTTRRARSNRGGPSRGRRSARRRDRPRVAPCPGRRGAPRRRPPQASNQRRRARPAGRSARTRRSPGSRRSGRRGTGPPAGGPARPGSSGRRRPSRTRPRPRTRQLRRGVEQQPRVGPGDEVRRVAQDLAVRQRRAHPARELLRRRPLAQPPEGDRQPARRREPHRRHRGLQQRAGSGPERTAA